MNSIGFSIWNGLSHFLSFKTIPFLLGGAALNRLACWGLVTRAGSGGRLLLGGRALVQSGQLTGAGHFAAGTLTGACLSLGLSVHHLFAKDLPARRPEAWANFTKNFGAGLLINAVALGFSGAGFVALRRRFPPLIDFPGKGKTPSSLVHLIVGTGGMVSANALFRAVHNLRHPEEKGPLVTLDETVETALNLTAFHRTDSALQRIFTKKQLGPFLAHHLERITKGLPEVLPLQRTRRKDLEKSLALQILRGVPLMVAENFANRFSLP